MEYLLVMGIAGAIWITLFLVRTDLRKAMLWSGFYYTVILSAGFILLKIAVPHLSPEKAIVPGFWNPDTLFNLGRITGGFSIEDVLYMFFTGGYVTAIYETFFHHHLKEASLKSYPHLALKLGAFVAVLVGLIFHPNLIWVLIAFGFGIALTIWIQRPDLISQSITGGVIYVAIYLAMFFIVTRAIFPHFLQTYYNLPNLSGIMVLGSPLEEFLFVLSFGLSWSPIYKYKKNLSA